MLGHHLLDVGAGAEADLQRVAIEGLAHQGALALVDQGQELGADVGVDIDPVGQVPPDNIPCPLPPGRSRLVGQGVEVVVGASRSNARVWVCLLLWRASW